MVLLADDSTVVCVIIHEEEIVGGAEGGRQTEEIGGRGDGKLCQELELLCKQKTSNKCTYKNYVSISYLLSVHFLT